MFHDPANPEKSFESLSNYYGAFANATSVIKTPP
jgi:hypothetical protein